MLRLGLRPHLRSEPKIRRCRPLLGTFVEITASGNAWHRLGLNPALDLPSRCSAFHEAVDAAFAAMKKIQNMMSAHDPASELSLLNREAAHRIVTVSRETYEVLRRADRMAVESKGAFDYTVAPTLARWGLLPATLQCENAGNWRDVLLLRRRQVRFLRPLTLDLGGIAKGFAVDQAIEVLREHGVASAMVNAGGDLRVFGAQSSRIHLRHPSQPQQFAHRIELAQAALATSSPCFTEKNLHGQRVSHLVDSIRQTAVTGVISVSVRAQECWLADALTKVVLNAPQLAQKMLAKYGAEAFVLTA
ncbi:MAG: FAD:protein FMN transferase [Verrucomicrobiales bacterium]|nr:FAD:protein FMN transferase [Verrucomicrobiales bacterium]